MSLMQALVGESPYADLLLAVLDLKREQTGRFRDCYLRKHEEELQIVIFTRNNGIGREDLLPISESLKNHPMFVSDEIETSDQTFQSYAFNPPAANAAEVAYIWELTKNFGSPMERFHKMLAKLKDTATPPDDPDIVRAKEIGERIFKPLLAESGGTVIINPDGSVEHNPS